MQNNSRNNVEKLIFKILSVIIAIALWLIILYEINPEITKKYNDVSITYEFAQNNGLSLVEPYPREMDIVVKGHRNDILYLKKDDIIIFVDLSDAISGRKEHKVNVQIGDDEKFKIESQDFKTLPLEISKEKKK